MTRKHFQAMAEALRYSRPERHWSANKAIQWLKDVKEISFVCSNFNPRFDESKFFEACGADDLQAVRATDLTE